MINNVGPKFEIVNSGSTIDTLEPSIIKDAISVYDFSKSVLNAGTGTLVDEKGVNPLTFTYNQSFTTVTSQGLDGISVEQTSTIQVPDEYTIAYCVRPHSLTNFSGNMFSSKTAGYFARIDIGSGRQTYLPSDVVASAQRSIDTRSHEVMIFSGRSSGGYFCMSDYNHYALYRPDVGPYPSGAYDIGLTNVSALIVWAAIIPKFIDNVNDAYILKQYINSIALSKGLTVTP